ncbi:hypothetical protein EDD86DRAFT_203299 [Gorgonomyces haynaldii]|nr:hypothetical protein EDD86DRAFT_203299 [Gorgonomyces haynaldii]
MGWSIHKDNNTGKSYYFNSVTRQSTWEKPPELKSAMERALEFSDWQEFVDDETGNKYYFNKKTEETTWDLPPEFNEIAESMKFEKEAEKQLLKLSAMPTIVSFETKEEAQDAWYEMLKVMGCDPTWDWDTCIRKCSGHPAYRALRSASDRKEAFESFIDNLKKESEFVQKERLDKDTKKLVDLLKTLDIDLHTSFKTVNLLLRDNPIYSEITPGNRRPIYRKYIQELKEQDKETQRTIRKSNLEKIGKLLNELKVDHTFSWRKTKELIYQHPKFASDPTFSKMDPMDILVQFEDHVLKLDAEFRKTRSAQIKQERRQERIIRDGYRDLLREARKSGILTMKSKWKDFYQKYKSDERYLQMLGNPGSNPLEMFWDEQMYVEDKFRSTRRRVQDAMRSLRLDPDHFTDYQDFTTKLSRDIERLDPQYVRMVYDDMVSRFQRDERYEKLKSIDSIYEHIKRMEPPVTLSDDYESFVAKVTLPEFRDLDRQQRMQLYDRIVARLKDKKRLSEMQDDRKSKYRKRADSEEEGEVR